MALSQIVFYSRNLVNMSGGSMRGMVKDILASCNRYERGSGLTGALAFNEQFFLQAMEGDAAAVSEQLWTLAADNRHSSMVLVSARTIPQRDFRGWMVGYAGQSDALDELYLRYGTIPKMDPTTMRVDGIVGLLRGFSELDGTHFVQRSDGRTIAAGPAQARKATA